MLVYHDVPQPVLTDYTIRSFDTKYECIEYTWDNKPKNPLDVFWEQLGDKEKKYVRSYRSDRNNIQTKKDHAKSTRRPRTNTRKRRG